MYRDYTSSHDSYCECQLCRYENASESEKQHMRSAAWAELARDRSNRNMTPAEEWESFRAESGTQR